MHWNYDNIKKMNKFCPCFHKIWGNFHREKCTDDQEQKKLAGSKEIRSNDYFFCEKYSLYSRSSMTV